MHRNPSPAAVQCWLFPWHNPLANRMGTHFFSEIPPQPGVYLMRGEKERVLYVGQSKNLRQRLQSYKYISPDRSARKLLRLVHKIEDIEYHTCETATEAKLRENVLIRKFRPPFNSVNTHPESHLFIQLTPRKEGFIFGYSNRPEVMNNHPGSLVYGAFKSLSARRGLVALFRLAWLNECHPDCVTDLPLVLNRHMPPQDYPLRFNPDLSHNRKQRLKRKVLDFFTGKSPALVNKLCGKSGELIQACPDPWLKQVFLRDRDYLQRFFDAGTLRNRKLKESNRIGPKRTITQTQLDDLVVTAGGDADVLLGPV